METTPDQKVRRVVRCDLERGIVERLTSGRPITGNIASSVTTRSALLVKWFPPDADTLLLLYANTFTPAHACMVASVRERSDARIVLRARYVFDDFLGWADRFRVGFVSLDLTNGITVARCIERSIGAPYLPRGAVPALTGRIGDFLGDYVASANPPTIGVVSLPRSGSKVVADSIVHWGAPTVRVFHAHDMSDLRADQISMQMTKATTREASRAAALKHQLRLEMLKKLDQADRIAFVTIERSPESRIISEFIMNRRREIESYYEGNRRIDLQDLLDRHAGKDHERLLDWYERQFKRFGIELPFAGLRPDSDDYMIVPGRNPLLILRTEKLSQHLSDSGLANEYVSSNSATERGYGKIAARFKEEFHIASEILDRIYAIPSIKQIHGSFPREFTK